jgi:hypothetical protein
MKNHLPNPNKYNQGFYIPLNPHKYSGKLPIRCLSSWEFKVCKMMDLNENVISWASESVGIKYINPIKSVQYGKEFISTYYPDYTIVYIDKFGKKHKELVEVKPKRQAFMEAAKSKKEKLDVILNTAKWQAARAFAAQYGYKFRIITEDDIFGGKR